jgi:hypothetical protein
MVSKRTDRMRATTSILLACTLGSLILSACGGGSSSVQAPVVPGGAALTVKAGTPPICKELVQSPAIRGLATDLMGLTGSPPASRAAEGLRRAAGELRSLANQTSGVLRVDLTATASALESLRSQGINSAAAVMTLNNTLKKLGAEVQIQCEFPVG